jgi:hypothetical protein
MPIPDRSSIVRFLLGRAGEAESAELKARMEIDAEFAQQAAIVEDDLVDEYVQGRLSEVDARDFRNHYMTGPERLQKVNFASALLQSANAERAGRRRAPALVGGVALIVGLLLGLALQPRQGGLVRVALHPGMVRAEANGATIVIPDGTAVVRLELHTERAGARRASIRRLNSNSDVLSVEIEPPAGAVATVDVPAGILRPGEYLITAWSGEESVGRFYLRAKK